MTARPQFKFSQRPVVGVGGIVIVAGKALLIRRAHHPLKGKWSIPGGKLEFGETLLEAVQRELAEETGIEVRVLELIGVFETISPVSRGQAAHHFVVLDYLCQLLRGEAHAASDVTDVAWASETDLKRYSLTTEATTVLHKAFDMVRQKKRADQLAAASGSRPKRRSRPR